MTYQVIVGNIGTVHDGSNYRKAYAVYSAYVKQSKDQYGRAGSPTKFSAGDTIVGFGLHNAGRYCTVLEVSKSTRGRIRINRHLDDKTLWTFDTWYRLAD